MSQVVDDDDRTYRRRRQRRATIVIVVVLLGLAGAFYYASTYFRESAPKPQPCTTVVAPAPLTPEDVSLNVYNSTGRGGLAATVAKQAGARGFKIKAVGNDPKGRSVTQVAQIRFGPDGEASAKLLKTHVPQAVLVDDKRKGDTIDLAVGAAWKGFGKVPVVATPTPTLPLCPSVTTTP